MRQVILDKVSEQIEQGVYPGASLAFFLMVSGRSTT